MPSKDKKTISARISEKDFEMIETYSNTHNISISAIMSLCIKAFNDGDIRIEKGELKTGVDPIGYGISEEIDTPFGQKIDRKFDKLRERGYPEAFIDSMKEQILNGIESQLDLLPKKFDMRKMRDMEC